MTHDNGQRPECFNIGFRQIGLAVIAGSPVAAESSTAITDAGLLDKIDIVLDELEKDPGQARLRQYRWSDPPLWGAQVRDRVRDYLVLWALEKRDSESMVVVYYVGPDV
jgi:hypothetical protein